MKTKYLFCKCAGDITRDTLFVDVYVGTSLQDRRDLVWLANLAQPPLYFFHRWDIETDHFVSRLRRSLQEPGVPAWFYPRHVSVGIRQLRRLLVAGAYDAFTQIFVAKYDANRRMNLCANHAHESALRLSLSKSLQSAHVKNLKPTGTESWTTYNSHQHNSSSGY